MALMGKRFYPSEDGAVTPLRMELLYEQGRQFHANVQSFIFIFIGCRRVSGTPTYSGMVQRSRSGSGGHGQGMYMNMNGDSYQRAPSVEDGRQVCSRNLFQILCVLESKLNAM